MRSSHNRLGSLASAVAGCVCIMYSSHSMGMEKNEFAKLTEPAHQSIAAYRATRALNAAPAKWIWFPSQRTLPNTFVLFRQELQLEQVPAKAKALVCADSRYRLFVNGKRVAWGPAPHDPRWPEVDLLDLQSVLKPGRNVLAAEVLYYGQGDGTYALGKPGFLFKLELESETTAPQLVVSDSSWKCMVDRAHPPGMHRRWYLRALQEVFDFRQHPVNWTQPEFTPGPEWMSALELNAPSDNPAATSSYMEFAWDMQMAGEDKSGLRTREIPQLETTLIAASKAAEAGSVKWLRDPDDWFDFRIPGSFAITPGAAPPNKGPWTVPATPSQEDAQYVTFEWKEQGVGWPVVTIDAPEGAIVELMPQEAHDSDKTHWLDSQFFAWSRTICREGENVIEPFDFESFRWLQLHVRNAARPVTIKSVEMRRRSFPWQHKPQVRTSDVALQRLFGAAENTIVNSAQDICVDGMARERQQYSGDGGHQLVPIRYGFGEYRLPKRFLETFCKGQTLDGYFLDCWPAWDRMARLIERQINSTSWGPLLDHGVGFNFDCALHYMDTGDLDSVREAYPHLLRFADYLKSIRGTDGLLPVENIGVPSVWIDHDAFRQQRHKQCAFNLYVAGMFEHALAPLARAMGETEKADAISALGSDILKAANQRFWSEQQAMFVSNLPWLKEEGAPRLDDRSLAMGILFDQCPDGKNSAAMDALATSPPNMGISYPCNAGWRYAALAKGGRVDVVLGELRTRWATMPSVVLNNTLQEYWTVQTDSADQWSHSAVAPLQILYMGILGLRPTEPGFAACEIRPQLGDLQDIEMEAQTVRGPVKLVAKLNGRSHHVTLTIPQSVRCTLLLPQGASGEGIKLAEPATNKLSRWEVTSETVTLKLPQ